MLIAADRQGRTAASAVRSDRGRSVLLPAAAVVLGVALTAVVAAEGSPAWQLIRGLVTIAVVMAIAVDVLRRPGRSAGLAATGLGIVGTAVGAGIGLPHAAKGGAAAQTVAGLAALLAGLVLAVGGVAAVVRRVRGWWRVPIVATAVPVGIAVIFSLSIAVAATNVPSTSLGDQTPADRGLAYRAVEFTATDGVTLSGWYLPGGNGAAVVLLHGAGSTRSAVLDHAVALARHGYGVLLFDARGHGLSSGRTMDFGWYGDEDVGGAVDYLAAQPGVERIAAVGVSMGGEEAIGAAAVDGRIGAVVAEGATNRVSGDKAWLPDAFGLRGWIQRPLDWLTYTAADVLTDTEPPSTLRAAAAAANRPMLLIAAGDVTDEGHAARYIAAGSAGTVEVWEVPDTGHTEALSNHREEWERRVTTFLARALDVHNW